ncbi:MAG TPA: phage major capsid protein [Acidimicrobiia bacterium]
MTTEDAKRQNDVRQRAHMAAREVLERAEREGRGLTSLRGEERAALKRADEIIADTRTIRDEIVRRDEALHELEGVTDEFRRMDARPDPEGRAAFDAFTSPDIAAGKVRLDLDLGAAARAFQAFKGGARGQELRAFTSDSSSATGGSLVLPQDVALNVYASMTAACAMRQTRATVITTEGGARMRFPKVAVHGIGTALANQNTGYGGTDPVLSTMNLDAWDAVQLVAVSSDMLEDTGIDVLGFVAQSVGRALGKLTGQWYATGTGSSQPTGVVNAGGTGSAGTIATGGSLILGAVGSVGEKLWDFVHSIDSQYRPQAEWVMRDLTLQTISKLRDGAGGTVGRWLFDMSPTSGLPGGTPDRICGYPVWPDSNIASMASDASIAVFGDMSAYYVRDVRGVQLTRSDQNRWDKNEVVINGLLRTDANLIDQTAVNVLHQAVS